MFSEISQLQKEEYCRIEFVLIFKEVNFLEIMYVGYFQRLCVRGQEEKKDVDKKKKNK